MIKVGICGHFGDGRVLVNGQTVKTKILKEELQLILGLSEVISVDTHNWRKRPFKLLLNCFKLINNCENVIILPAHNGVKVFVPLFLVLNRLFSRKIHYIVIGGWLPSLLKKNLKLCNQVSKIDVVYVETKLMLKSLEELGLHNIKLLTNFKRLNILKNNELFNPLEKPYKLCTFSRVMKEKGIEDAINVVTNINETLDRVVYTLDIFGPIDNSYLNRFEHLKSTFPNYISYCGVVNFNESTQILRNYFALLFPTWFKTEGVPGTIIDAYAAGVPVIASKWESADEIVINNETGFIYDYMQNKQLNDLLIQMLENPEVIIKMKINCLEKAKEFSPQIVIEKIVGLL